MKFAIHTGSFTETETIKLGNGHMQRKGSLIIEIDGVERTVNCVEHYANHCFDDPTIEFEI